MASARAAGVPAAPPARPLCRRTTHGLRAATLAGVLALGLAAGAAATEWTPTRSFRIFSKASFRGLPQSSVMTLAQDAQGVLWIGTLDGAASFDGREIVPVPAVDGAPVRGMITTIVASRRHGVLFGSPAGVHAYSGGGWRLLASEKAVAAVAEAGDGTLYMADGQGGLWAHDGRQWKPWQDLGTAVVGLSTAPDGTVWAATPTGAAALRDGRAVELPGDPLPSRPGAFLVARDGRLWVATQGGTVHWRRPDEPAWHQAPFASWPRGAFRCLAEDRRGRVWAGSYGGGVAWGTAGGPWQVWTAKHGPFAAGVMAVFADREGSVWFGLNALGLAQWIGEAWSHRTVVDVDSPVPQLFSAFGVARGATPGTILVGAFQNGLLQLGPGETSRAYAAAAGITEDIRAVAEPAPGTLWAGGRFAIFESEGGGRFREALRLPTGFVMGFFAGPDGRWYAGTSSQGVLERRPEGWVPAAEINAGLDNQHVRSMLWHDDELWVATLRGITRFVPGRAPEHLDREVDAAIPESVNALLAVGDEVWAGGTGGMAVGRPGAWRRLGAEHGLPGQTVYSLARGPDGSVWIGGSAGVGRFAHGSFRVWDSRSGLLQEECNLGGLLVEPDGSVWVGTMGGFAHFDPRVAELPLPALVLAWREAPPLVGSGQARLPAGERALRLRWSAAWLDPRPVEYRVRVPRLREGWSPPQADDHLAVENLDPGTWTVMVQARVEGSAEWSPPLELAVVVPPLWHETLAARLAGVALLALLVLGLVRLRLRGLRRHAAALEATVRERTAELAEKVEQLEESERRALAASHAKSVFLANMSHELRTPLNGVIGFAQLLARRPGRDAEDREGLSVILRSGRHLLGLINDVLSLSKIEAGRVSLDEAPFDVATLVEDAAGVLRLTAAGKGLELVCEVDRAALPRAVHGDQGRLRQILLNLLGNAVKFTTTGKVTLRAGWAAGRGVFEVEDTGPGIAADELAGLFEPFVQTETGRQSREGTGLGLALSRDLARLMGGDVTVESAPGKGSRFRVEVGLPEAPASALARIDGARRVAGLAPGQPQWRLLVVDDVAINRIVLARLLAGVGFAVREAASGLEALQAWRQWQPHLVWMDKRMPDLDGLEVTRRIRAEERAAGRGAHTPILALSASALDHERGEILAAGCDDFVAKPFQEATIFAKLREHLGVDYVYEDVPVAEPVERRTGAAAPPVAAVAAAAAGDERPGRVLVVDDDWVCRQVAVELLRAHGVDVAVATSGAEAVAAVERHVPDLVLMDLQMPEVDGATAARRIRERPGGRHLPIVAMTAETFDGERERFAATGMDDVLAKPLEPDPLAVVLDRWLRPAGAGRAGAAAEAGTPGPSPTASV